MDLMELPKHFREIPPEWDGLMAASSSALSFNEPATLQARRLFEVVHNGVQDERIDANIFFALGLVMCSMSSMLKNDEIRIGIEDDASVRLTDYVRGQRDFSIGLQLNDIFSRDLSNGNMSYSFLPVARQAMSDTDARMPGFELLGNTLLESKNIRLLTKNTGSRTINFSNPMEPYERIVKGLMLPGEASITSTTAPTMVLLKALISRRQFQTGQSYEDVVKENAPISIILGGMAIRDLAIRQATNRLARTRTDIIGRWFLEEDIETDEFGRIMFEPPSKLPANDNLLRQEALMCPAFTVHKFIPQVFNIIYNVFDRVELELAA